MQQPPIAPGSASADVRFLEETRQERERFNGLIVRQLLAKHNLLPKVRSIAEFVGRRRSQPDGVPAALASTYGITSLDDAAMLATFFGGAMDDAECRTFTRRLLRLDDAAVEATEVLHLRGFLGDADIDDIFRAARALCKADGKCDVLPSGGADGAAADTSAHDVQYGAAHVALNLHRGGHFARTCPALFARILRGMRSQPSMYFSPQIGLHVRCIEFHTYTAGDGLSTQGHRDQGSVLTMSMLLSSRASFAGGVFLTSDSVLAQHKSSDARASRTRGHVQHPIQRGDAILFHSEKMHNVQPVTQGVRHALVVELWLQPANQTDRFR